MPKKPTREQIATMKQRAQGAVMNMLSKGRAAKRGGTGPAFPTDLGMVREGAPAQLRGRGPDPRFSVKPEGGPYRNPDPKFSVKPEGGPYRNPDPKFNKPFGPAPSESRDDYIARMREKIQDLKKPKKLGPGKPVDKGPRPPKGVRISKYEKPKKLGGSGKSRAERVPGPLYRGKGRRKLGPGKRSPADQEARPQKGIRISKHEKPKMPPKNVVKGVGAAKVFDTFN